MTTLKTLGTDLAVAVAAGVLSYAASPRDGVQVHWSPEDADPWRAPALAYALGVPFFVFVLCRVVMFVMKGSSTRAQRSLRIECAASVALIVYAGLQRIPDFSVLLAFAGALITGFAAYSRTGSLARSSGSGSEEGADAA